MENSIIVSFGEICKKLPGVDAMLLAANKDNRGPLTELFRRDWFANHAPAMCYISVTYHGKIRGPHEHWTQSDCFCFAGPGDFTLYLWENRRNKRHSINSRYRYELRDLGESNPFSIIIPPGIVHAYRCTKGPGTVINIPDKLYKGWGKSLEVDEIRHEADPNTIFRLD